MSSIKITPNQAAIVHFYLLDADGGGDWFKDHDTEDQLPAGVCVCGTEMTFPARAASRVAHILELYADTIFENNGRETSESKTLRTVAKKIR